MDGGRSTPNIASISLINKLDTFEHSPKNGNTFSRRTGTPKNKERE
jgi:hypothetical protein